MGPRAVLDEPHARVVAFELLALKAWSSRDLTRRLRRRGAPPEVAAAVVGDLTSRGYLDDESFARFWAEARARGRRLGSIRLRQELRAKGIPPALVTAAVTAAFDEVPETERVLDAARRRLTALQRGPAARVAPRLTGYLLRRGYPPAAVARTVRHLLNIAADEPPD